jgi:hypothetical protein
MNVVARWWYWPVGVLTLVLCWIGGSLRAESAGGSLPVFVAAVVAGLIFQRGYRSARAHRRRDEDDQNAP